MRTSWKANLVNAFPVPADHPSQRNSKSIADNTAHLTNSFQPRGTFPFLSLPGEIRRRIYHLVLFTPVPRARTATFHASRLSLLSVSKRVHTEFTHVLYTTTTFRLFPLQDFLSVPTPLQIPLHYRPHITKLSLTLGPSWTSPPKSWRVTRPLMRCLAKMKGVRVLKVFVELDPSQPMFALYRVSYSFYTDFCGSLLSDVVKALPRLEVVEIDGNPSVSADGPLVSRLVQVAEAAGNGVVWALGNGLQRGREACEEVEEQVGSIETQVRRS